MFHPHSMDKLIQSPGLLKLYLPLFFLICLSGNPFFTLQDNYKNLLVIYTIFFSLYVYKELGWLIPMKIVEWQLGLIGFIVIILLFQKDNLGFVSYPGAFALILKIILGLFTILYYDLRKIDILDTYIKILSFIVILSIPFFILNQFGYYGFGINTVSEIRSFILFTSTEFTSDEIIPRVSGMFWEPGAYAGYLILALMFVFLKNGKFTIGPYKKEVFIIICGLISSQSTTGYVVLLLLLSVYGVQNFSWGKIIIVPLLLLMTISAYKELPFLKEKIDYQILMAQEMNNDDISNTRFGSLNMDLQYIRSQPLFGNGLNIKTRYRFHPEVTDDIGNGNGMSNFLASWGIPLFLIWLFCTYKFAQNVSQSRTTAIIFIVVIMLILQGEQFLNYPLFLMFFSLPFAYNNTISKSTYK